MAMATATDSPYRTPASYLEAASPPPTPPADSAWAAQANPPPPESASAPAAGSGSVGSLRGRARSLAAASTARVAARVAAAALCLISFSVMAADKNRGWTLDSFDRYNEYRYCVTVNVLGFLYAGLQALAEVHRRINKKHIVNRPLGFCFDFVMDQIMAYLLISAASSATSRTNYWVANWGNDPFPSMISGSVAMSFLAFMAFAVSSLVSAFNLFSSRRL